MSLFACVALIFAWCCGVAHAGPEDAVGALAESVEEKKSDKQLEIERRLAAVDAANAAKAARVVVLQAFDTDYRHDGLRSNIMARIARPDAKFYPEIDLYQSGRKEVDRTLGPTGQRGSVPDSVIPRIRAAVDDISSIPWDGLSEEAWGLRASELLRLTDDVWFVDRPELREPLFLLYAYIGYAADNQNSPSPPYYEQVGGTTVNYFWYLAATMAHSEPALMSKLTDSSVNASVNQLKEQLESRRIPFMTLSFDLDGTEFEVADFIKEFQLFVNGNEEEMNNSDGLFEVPLGRADVYLKRTDGSHSLSDRVSTDRLTDGFYFVRGNARKKMGIDFQEQLMEHPYECIPALDGDILTYLSIYASLHPEAEVYIAVPKAGSTAPGRIFLWRWDRAAGVLQRVADNTGGFPVRFSALFSTGVAFGTVDLADPQPVDLAALASGQEPGAPLTVPYGVDSLLPSASLVLDGVPLEVQLRGHYNRLMVGVGASFKVGTGGADSFVDLYQTDGRLLTETVDGTESAVLRRRAVQRLVYAMVGGVLGRDASLGFGPRAYLRTGWTNAPHAVDLTAHAGLTKVIGGDQSGRTGRVATLIDIDGFVGVLGPVQDSLYVYRRRTLAVGPPLGTFGITAGAGLTF